MSSEDWKKKRQEEAQQPGKPAINESDHIHEAWYMEAAQQTPDTLMEFCNKVMDSYTHDYGTVCHAIAACAVATAWAMNRHPGARGGITGFQSGAVMWQFIRHWGMEKEAPLRLLNYGNLLYPQYKKDFVSIDPDTLKWAREEAAKRLREMESDGSSSNIHPDVAAHWRKLVESDDPPFGLTVGRS